MNAFLSSFRLGALVVIFLMSMNLVVNHARAETVYKFGVVPQFAPRKLADIWLPIFEELENRTGLKFVMIGSTRIPDFEISFLAGDFDFAYMNPYHAMVASLEQGYVPLNRDHGRKLFGILVVKKDSTIQGVKELHGKTISFPSPNALGASLLMRADLAKQVEIEIKPRYVDTHSSVYLNVIFGKTPAGGGVMGSLRQQDQEVQDALRIIYKTRQMSPHPVTAHPRVPADHVELVRKAFLEMGKTDKGAALLAKVPFKKIGPANLEEYLELKEWGLEKFYTTK